MATHLRCHAIIRQSTGVQVLVHLWKKKDFIQDFSCHPHINIFLKNGRDSSKTRPKQTWCGSVVEDLKAGGMKWNELGTHAKKKEKKRGYAGGPLLSLYAPQGILRLQSSQVI